MSHAPQDPRTQRLLLRSGKSPYDVVSVEEALEQDVIATNSGNLIFSDATHKILETPRTEVVSNGIRTDVSAAGRINEEFDAFVIPLANAFRPSFEAQLTRLQAALAIVGARGETEPKSLVISGAGEFLARELIRRVYPDATVVSLAEKLGPTVSACAPAHALAVLAAETPL